MRTTGENDRVGTLAALQLGVATLGRRPWVLVVPALAVAAVVGLFLLWVGPNAARLDTTLAGRAGPATVLVLLGET